MRQGQPEILRAAVPQRKADALRATCAKTNNLRQHLPARASIWRSFIRVWLKQKLDSGGLSIVSLNDRSASDERQREEVYATINRLDARIRPGNKGSL